MTQVREDVYFTKDRVIARAKTVKRGDAKKIDYLLFSNRKPSLIQVRFGRRLTFHPVQE
jgi:hypothetical protein